MMICKRCAQQKEHGDFYADDRTCKECRKAAVRSNRAKKIAYYKQYDAMRYRRDEHRREHAANTAKLWAKTDRGKAVAKKRREFQSQRYKARAAVQYALRDGRLLKLPCEVCGVANTQGHHDDYDKPLDVRWLCPFHHAEHHRINGKSEWVRAAAMVPSNDHAPAAETA